MGLFSRKKTDAAVPEPVAEITEAGEAAPDAMADELIAVIAAAVSAYEAEQFRQTLYIQKINRAYNVRPAWGAMGTQEAIDNRRM